MSNPIRRLYQSFFVIGDPSGTTSGAIYGKEIVLPNGRLGEPNSFSHEMYGDVLSIGGFSTFSAGDTFTSEISITWSGSNVFDPSAVSSLLLTWGADGPIENYPFGDAQGTTSTSAVPDTGSTAALPGVGLAALAFARRKRG